MHDRQINCAGGHFKVHLPAPVGPVNTTISPVRKPLHISVRPFKEGDCEPAVTETSQGLRLRVK